MEFEVPAQPLDIPATDSNSSNFKNVKELKVGAGDNGFYAIFPEGIWLGAEKFADAPFSVDIEGNAKANSFTVTGGTIKFGKTAYTDDTNSGYWLGNVTGTPKFNIGSSATKYLHYDGTDFTLSGGNISGGTITGATIQTAATGQRAVLSSALLDFYIDTSHKGNIATDGVNSMLYSSLLNHLFFDFGGNYQMGISNDGINLAAGNTFSIGASVGNSSSNQFVTTINYSGSNLLRFKGRIITCTGGIVSDVGAESGYYDIHQF